MGPSAAEERSEIAFFDVETTVPTRSGQGFSILEFGAILLCPRTLVVLKNYSTLVRPADPSQITSLSVRCNGITRDKVESAPSFLDIADQVYNILHGHIWAGHNIIKFDCARIREAFHEIGRPTPEPKGIIDSLTLLTQRFGRRAGDMKMATLATYFGIGKQNHRSLDDVRMNLEVLKYCATVLFLESSLLDANTAKQHGPYFPDMSSTAVSPEGCSGFAGFLELDEVSPTDIGARLVPWFPGSQKIELLHKSVVLQLFCSRLRVRFGVSTKFADNLGRPRLNFVVDASPSLHKVLDECDKFAQKFYVESGSTSGWRDVVIMFGEYPTTRLRIPITSNGGVEQITTEIHQKDCSGTTQKLVFSKLDTAELIKLIRPGALVDAFFSFDLYDYQGRAGMRLVAKKLIIHSEE